MPTIKTARTKNGTIWNKEQLAGAEGKGRLVAFQRPCLRAHLPQAQGFTGVNSPPLNSTYWLEEKPDLNVFGKKRELHSLLSQCSRITAPTQGTMGKNEKSTRSHARNTPLLALPSFHFSFQLPFLQKLLAFFHGSSFPCQKRSQQWCPWEVSHTRNAKAQKHQEGAVTGSTANGSPQLPLPGRKNMQGWGIAPILLKLSPT